MISISAEGLSKRYDYNWIIKDWSHDFLANSITGISGRNGSGKSTLLKILSGYLPPSKGELHYLYRGYAFKHDQLYQHLAMVAPYTDLIAEFTMEEMFRFHTQVRSMRDDITYPQFVDIVELQKTHQQIQYFSSGMNQRLQLALQILSDTPLLLLDEPTSYLDTEARRWTYRLLEQYSIDRTIIISSNDFADFDLASSVIPVRPTAL